MRRATGVFLAVVLAGAVAFVLLATTDTSRHAFSLGAPLTAPAVTLQPGQNACQAPVNVPIGGAFRSVRFQLGTFRRPGPALELRLRDAHGRTLARRTLPAGYPDISRPAIDLGRRFAGRGYRVCFRNRGHEPVAIYGSAGAAVPASTVTVDGTAVGVDLGLSFERPARSKAAELGDILDRATLFRSPRLSGAVYGVLLVLLLAAAAGGVAVALKRADHD